LPSRFEHLDIKLTDPVALETIVGHMAASVGREKAETFTHACCSELRLPATGTLEPADADRLLNRMGVEPGLVGIAARLTKQMVRLKRAPSRPSSP
jgi:hypothetical protein